MATPTDVTAPTDADTTTSPAAPALTDSRLSRLSTSAWFAYTSIVAIQLRVLSGRGGSSDLPIGDTVGYFASAWAWAHGRGDLGGLAYSPTYKLLLAAIIRVVDDVPDALLAHRVLTVVALTVTVLAIGRRLIPPWAAWLVAVWWACLPTTHNTLEVHTAGAVTALVPIVIASRGRDTATRRAIVLLVLAIGAITMRSELLLAGIIVAADTIVAHRQGRLERTLKPYLAAAAVTLVVAAAALGVTDPGPEGRFGGFTDRSVVAFCQHYAVNTYERDEIARDPWRTCRDLMVEDFGAARVTAASAARRSPGQFAEHVLDTARMLPSGVQLVMLGETSADRNPDVVPRRDHSARAALLTVAGSVVIAAAVARRRGWRWPATRLTTVAIAGTVATCILPALTLRPRVGYLLPLGALLAIAVGGAFAHVAGRRAGQLISTALPAVALVAVLALPGYTPRPQPTLEAYRALEHLEVDGDDVLVAEQLDSLCRYLSPTDPCEIVPPTVLDGAATADDVDARLQAAGATFAQIPAIYLGSPAVTAFIDQADQRGWTVLERERDQQPHVWLARTDR